MIQDEKALLEPVDFTVMARIYEWQAMAADPELDPQYRSHYKRRIEMVRDELDVMLKELDRAQ